MGHRIIYFYKKENVCYKKEDVIFSRGKNFDDITVFYCGIPEYYRKSFVWEKGFVQKTGWKRRKGTARPVGWNTGQLLRLLQSCCEYVSADAYYLEEAFEREFSGSGMLVSSGQQRMCGSMIEKLTGQFREVDSILYIAGEEQTGMPYELSIREQQLRKLHYFFYLGEKSESYFVLEENLWQEYGMLLIRISDLMELKAYQIKRLLVLDDEQKKEDLSNGRRQGRVILQKSSSWWKKLPEKCVYLDLWSDPEKRRQITENRVDIKYLSEYLYLAENLDTSGENGYNSPMFFKKGKCDNGREEKYSDKGRLEKVRG